MKLHNQKLQQDNLELLKSPGGGAGGNGSGGPLPPGITPEKLRMLDEQLLKAKDEVIDLQKKFVDVYI